MSAINEIDEDEGPLPNEPVYTHKCACGSPGFIAMDDGTWRCTYCDDNAPYGLSDPRYDLTKLPPARGAPADTDEGLVLREPADIIPASDPTIESVKESMVELRKKHKWKKVNAPKAWRPRTIGEEIVGFYGGRTIRNGPYGQYEVALIRTTDVRAYLVTGVSIIQALDAANLTTEQAIRIVWMGDKDLGRTDDGKPKFMHMYEVYVADLHPIKIETA